MQDVHVLGGSWDVLFMALRGAMQRQAKLFCFFNLVHSRDLLVLVDAGDVHSEVQQGHNNLHIHHLFHWLGKERPSDDVATSLDSQKC